MDDSDVKIFKKEKRDDKFDEIGLISKMNEERGNGNIDKSKRLGSYLACRRVSAQLAFAK